MVLKLDTRVPVVWRDPFSLQFGVEPARVVLREVTTADERMIHALSSGISRSGLAMIAQTSGAGERDLVRLLERLDPLLLPDPPSPTPVTPTPVSRVSIAGAGRTVDLLAETLVAANLRVTVSPSPTDEVGDLGIAVGHYVLDPAAYGHWLRRDLPHLAVTFGDGSVSVGPLVEPGRTPCLYCLEFHRRDADKSWSAIASQLWGRRSAAETPLVSREVAALAGRLVARRLAGQSPGGPPAPEIAAPSIAAPSIAASFRIDAETGAVTRREWMPHPACGCGELNVAGLRAGELRAGEAPRGTGSAVGSVLPTRVVAAGELA